MKKLIGIFTSKKASIKERMSKLAQSSPKLAKMESHMQIHQQVINLAKEHLHWVREEEEGLRHRVGHLSEPDNLVFTLREEDIELAGMVETLGHEMVELLKEISAEAVERTLRGMGVRTR